MKSLCKKILQKEHIIFKNITEINSGAVSVVYLIDTGLKYLVIKIKLKPGRGLKNEYNILKLIEKEGISPKAYAQGNVDGRSYLIEEYVLGRKLSLKTMRDKDILLVANFFNKLHSMPLSKKLISLSKEDHSPVGRLEGPKSIMHLNKEFEKLISIAESKIRKVHIKKGLVLRHTDPNPNNFIIYKNSIIVVDWEWARVGYFAADIADFFVKGNLNDRQRRLFYKYYRLKNIQKNVEPYLITELIKAIEWKLEIISLIKKRKLSKRLYSSLAQERLLMNKSMHVLRKILNS